MRPVGCKRGATLRDFVRHACSSVVWPLAKRAMRSYTTAVSVTRTRSRGDQSSPRSFSIRSVTLASAAA